MVDWLKDLKEKVASLEEVDWSQYASFQALHLVELGEEFKDEMVGLMEDGENRYGSGVKSVEFNEDGSVKRVEFHAGEDPAQT